MFERIKFNWQLNKLQQTKRRVSALYGNDIKKARKESRAPDEIEDILRQEHHELDEISDDIRALQTSFLMQEAQRLLVPTPPMTKADDEYQFWKESYFTGRFFLKDAAAAELRAALRKERKERRDEWIPLLSVLIGLGGVTVGILSLLLKK